MQPSFILLDGHVYDFFKKRLHNPCRCIKTRGWVTSCLANGSKKECKGHMWTLASFFNASRILVMRSLLTYDVMSLKFQNKPFFFVYSLFFDWYTEPHLNKQWDVHFSNHTTSIWEWLCRLPHTHTHIHCCILKSETCFHLQIMFYWFSLFPKEYYVIYHVPQRFICLFCWSTVSSPMTQIADAATGFVIYSFFLVLFQHMWLVL